jgi:Uma2 family endonuclease
MHAHAFPEPDPDIDGEHDDVVVLHDVPWSLYKRLLRIRGDKGNPRMAYLDGELELVSPLFTHDRTSRRLCVLLSVYCAAVGLFAEPYGGPTYRKKRKRAGLEPDECFVFGPYREDRPDLAIEVVRSRPVSERKRAIYARLRVPEVWIVRDGRVSMTALQGGKYVPVARSRFVPDLPPAKVEEWLALPSQPDALHGLRAWLDASAPR